MAMGVRDAIRELKSHLAGCERGLVDSADAGDELIFDQADPTAVAKQMIASVRVAREHLDEAHKLIAEMRHNGDDDNDGDDDNELSFAGRSRRLDVLDRDDVGAVPRVREVGGAYLAYDMQADAQRRLDLYWGTK